MTRSRKILIASLAVIVLLVAARIALPYAVEDCVNDKLAGLDSYDGHVGDIDIHLWRGPYSIDEIEIVKTGAKRPVPFFQGESVNLSMEWRSLFRGSIVAEAEFIRPELNLVQGRNPGDRQLGKEANWNARLEELLGCPANAFTLPATGQVRALH